MDAASAARLYGQQPPPYSPPQAGYLTTYSRVQGDGQEDITHGISLPPVGFSAPSGDGSSQLPVLPPPSYEEATINAAPPCTSQEHVVTVPVSPSLPGGSKAQ